MAAHCGAQMSISLHSPLIWAELCPPQNPYVETLAPRTLECDYIGR